MNVTVCNGASIICSEVTEWVWAFLALWGCKLEVKSSLRWTRGAGNTRRSRGANRANFTSATTRSRGTNWTRHATYTIFTRRT